MKTITLTQPDDFHVHFRDHEILAYTVPATSQHFRRALIMPNLTPPLTTIKEIIAYRARILAHAKNASFEPLMTFYLNESINPTELYHARHHPFLVGAKLYPAGATTNSQQGAKSITALYPLLEVLQDENLVLQIHGEVTHGDIFHREALFLTEYLQPIIKQFPRLRIVLEHISSEAAVTFVENAPHTVAATITPHHLLYNRNHLLVGGIKPHFYCLPILKTSTDQKALQKAATSGNPKFFAGTDSAPHARKKKESACGCAGIYSAPFAIEMYAEIFEQLDQLAKLDHFLGYFGANFYGLPQNQQYIELIRQPQSIPDSFIYGTDIIIPAAAGEILQWSIRE